jgi:hypothetical protein
MEYCASLNRLVPDDKAREKVGTAEDPDHETPVRYWSSGFTGTKSPDLRLRARLTGGASEVELSLG